MKNDICEITCFHEDKVERAKEKLSIIDTPLLSSFFKIFADENRLKIIHALAYEDELCVCDIANIIDATVATTSHHLLSLKKAELVESRKEGKLVYYFIKNNRIINIINTGLSLKEEVVA